jgi:ketosteroid isomerase-like protein
MSREQVDVAKRAIDAFNRSDVDAFTTLTTADFEWSPSMVAIEAEVFRGSEGIKVYFASLSSAWNEFVILPDTFRTFDDVVVMLGGLRGHGKNSGATVDASLGMVFDLREGQISRIRGYLDHAEALRAAGAGGDQLRGA